MCVSRDTEHAAAIAWQALDTGSGQMLRWGAVLVEWHVGVYPRPSPGPVVMSLET